MAIGWCIGTCSSPKSKRWREWRTTHQIEWWGSGAHFKGAYLFGLLAFIQSHYVQFSHVFLFVSRKTTRSLQTLFWSMTKEFQLWECFKKIKMLPLQWIARNMLQNEGYCATFRTLGLNSVFMFSLTFVFWSCVVNRLLEACMFSFHYNVYFFPLSIRNSSISCTHKKVDFVSGRPGFQSTNSTPF